jgi:O-antigen biosynthesis protein WbqP
VKRAFDIALALFLIPVVLPIIATCAIVIRIDSTGPVFHISRRVGRKNTLFNMPKFRTMRLDTPQVATHLLVNPSNHLTRSGGFLRKTSLDELPQLWSVLRGDMSFVGPRPALFNQHDLVEARARLGIDSLRPGITGWAQINGRDEIPLEKKVELDREYAVKKSFVFDVKILLRTAWKAVASENISH